MTHPNRLPTIRLFDTDYFVDNRLHQLRNAQDPHDFMSFSEFETMVQLATLSIRHSGGAEAHPELTQQLYAQAQAYDEATGRTAATQKRDLFEALNVPAPNKRRARKPRM
jgi:hypothetical protein